MNTKYWFTHIALIYHTHNHCNTIMSCHCLAIISHWLVLCHFLNMISMMISRYQPVHCSIIIRVPWTMKKSRYFITNNIITLLTIMNYIVYQQSPLFNIIQRWSFLIGFFSITTMSSTITIDDDFLCHRDPPWFTSIIHYPFDSSL